MSLWAKSLPYTMPPCTLPFSNLYSDFEAIFGCLETTFIPRCSGDKQKQPCLSGNAETAYSQLERTAGSHLAQSRASLAESRLLGPHLVQFLDHFQGQKLHNIWTSSFSGWPFSPWKTLLAMIVGSSTTGWGMQILLRVTAGPLKSRPGKIQRAACSTLPALHGKRILAFKQHSPKILEGGRGNHPTSLSYHKSNMHKLLGACWSCQEHFF